MDKILRIGLVGCGFIAINRHIPILSKIKEVEIAALCDKSPERVNAVARRFKIKNTFTSFDDMLAQDLDAIDICTPPTTHAKLSIDAMKAGLHVMVEKPLASSVKEADEVIAASRKYGLKVCVLHNSSFSSAVRHAKSLVDNGEIGDLVGVRALLLGRKDSELLKPQSWVHSLPGGMWGEVAPHMAWLCLYFLGMPTINRVHAVVAKHSNLPHIVVDELRVLLSTNKGVASFTISYNSPADAMNLDIFGTKLNLHVDILSQFVIKQRESSINRRISQLMNNLSSIRQLFVGISSVSIKSLLGKIQTGHDYLIRKFVESIIKNSAPPVKVEDAREVVRLLEMIWPQINNPERLG